MSRYHSKLHRHLPLLFLLTATAVVMVYLVHHQVISMDRFASDTDEHIIITYKLFYDPHYYIAYPLWHATVFGLSTLFATTVETATVAAATLFELLWVVLVYYVVKHSLPLMRPLYWTLVTLVIIIIGPLCIPWYHKIIYLGQGSPNIWHNVTLWAVKPFALLTILAVLRALGHPGVRQYMVALLFVILSIFAKPSFIIAFLPAFFTLLLLKRYYRDRRILLFTLFLTLVTISILLIQYSLTFDTAGKSHIMIDFLGVWSRTSQNIPISILLALAFPLSLFFLKSSVIEDDRLLLTWTMTVISILYYALFAQSGRFYSHGNFGWSYSISMSLLYLFSIVKFFQIYRDIAGWKRFTLILLLMTQTLVGLYYLAKVLEGQNPLYIAIFL